MRARGLLAIAVTVMPRAAFTLALIPPLALVGPVPRAQGAENAVRAPYAAGAVDTTDHASVALCVGPTAAQCALRCSGTYIGPRLIVTARHCADADAIPAFSDCASVSADYPLLDPARVWVTSASVVANAAVSEFVQGVAWSAPASISWCGEDILLLSLATPVPNGAPLASPSFASPESLAQGITLTTSSYGSVPGDSSSAGTRRTSSGELACIGGRDACGGFDEASTLVAGEALVDSTVCPGDSGGGATLDSALVGVLSRTIASDGTCGLAVYAPIASHALLFARAELAAEQPGDTTPAWVAVAQQGNGGGVPARALGAPCDADADCDGAVCRSPDFGATWACAASCDPGSCASGDQCVTTAQGGACFPAPPRAGCDCASAPSNERPTGFEGAWVALGAVIAWSRRGRLRASSDRR